MKTCGVVRHEQHVEGDGLVGLGHDGASRDSSRAFVEVSRHENDVSPFEERAASASERFVAVERREGDFHQREIGGVVGPQGPAIHGRGVVVDEGVVHSDAGVLEGPSSAVAGVVVPNRCRNELNVGGLREDSAPRLGGQVLLERAVLEEQLRVDRVDTRTVGTGTEPRRRGPVLVLDGKISFWALGCRVTATRLPSAALGPEVVA